jgi:hypothetical protein
MEQKYCPKNLNEVLGCEKEINEIICWLNNYEKHKKVEIEAMMKKKNKKKYIKKSEKILQKTKELSDETIDDELNDIDDESNNIDIEESEPKENTITLKKKNNSCMFVYGKHGIGKSCVVKIILEQLNYEVKIINLSQMVAGKVDKILVEQNIHNAINEITDVKKALIIDEIQYAKTVGEKSFIRTILKKNMDNWYFPIIFIANTNHTLVIKDVKKCTINVMFNQPSYENMAKLVNNIISHELIYFENGELINNLINNVKYDYRKLIYALENINLNFPTTPSIRITKQIMENYFRIYQNKDEDIDIYTASKMLLTRFDNINNSLKLYESDIVKIPLTLQHNFLKYVIDAKTRNINTIDIIKELSESFSKADLIDEHIFTDQNWNMQNIYGFYGSVYPSYILNKNKILNLYPYVIFPKDIHKTSVKKKNTITIKKSNLTFKSFNINDYMYLIKLIRSLIENKKYKECSDVFKGYDIDIEQFEKILKIDKINDEKLILTLPIKKELMKYFSKKEIYKCMNKSCTNKKCDGYKCCLKTYKK